MRACRDQGAGGIGQLDGRGRLLGGARNRERGAISIVMVVACMLLTVVAIGGATIGIIVDARHEAQRVADAAVLSALDLVKERGLPFDASMRMAAEAVGRNNTNGQPVFTWTNATDNPRDVVIGVTVDLPVTVSTLIYDAGRTTVHAKSTAHITQQWFNQAQRRFPKLILVLDYSGSMRASMSGSRAIDVLEASVADLLNAGLEVEYGMVAFSTNVIGTIPISANAPAQIIDFMDNHDVENYTATGSALRAALGLLTNVEDTGRYVLLVSDGRPEPSAQVPLAREAAQYLWNGGVTIFTLQVAPRGVDSWLAQLLIFMSGPPDSPHNADYFFLATSASTLRDAFADIAASIVCELGPFSPLPADPSSLDIYLVNVSTHAEIKLQYLDRGTLGDQDHSGGYYYAWDEPSASVRITSTACRPIREGQARLEARYGVAGLTQ